MSSDVVGMNFLIAFGGGSLAGFLSGYALKKALKIIAFVVVIGTHGTLITLN
jgi:uncharacterized membrane protein (Fun14 family)